ncbi:hypothetical protein SAMN05444007_102228 [Cribrihabitans marinus]|uniref:Uncharacterized protein n=1 Tax=Cribrihabitans marinus TaxID=1227549 RepID=A0A1H6TAI4_9RHOB|nr:hypothetical protein [Cribrihabitans marinus]GGH22563.1 hypothetical protein GCM10010973_07960 [Cribrihabitans marinus]SEI73310.1 hypothetical protein SAMN05444007_102228 [Cribrihabitans marinus]
MTHLDLMSTAERLEQTLATAPLAKRIALQPEFSRVIHRMRVDGMRVPSRLQRLDAALCDEAVEAQFDNMPV